MANQLILGRALDANGFIMPGAKATVYADGTTTLIAVYADVDGTIPAANPIVADGNGMWPQRFVTEDAKVVVTNAANVPLYTLDPAPVAQGTGAAASAVSFAPSVDLPFTNVQTAIEGARAAALSGFAAFGLGITGNATLLANLDATGTGAGVYRFDGTTTGTFPSGVAAADTGMVELWRQAGATAMMELHHATSNRVFRRRLTASAWGAWREVVNVGQGAAEGDLIYRTATDWARLPKGTAGQALLMNAGATAPEWGTQGWTYTAPQSGSSGSAVDFTLSGTPTEVEVLIYAASLSGTDDLRVRVGPSAGVVTSGYTSTSVSAGSASSSTVGMAVFLSANTRTFRGAMRFANYNSGNKWVATHTGLISTTLSAQGGGIVTFSGAINTVRILPSGSDTFSSYDIAVRYR